MPSEWGGACPLKVGASIPCWWLPSTSSAGASHNHLAKRVAGCAKDTSQGKAFADIGTLTPGEEHAPEHDLAVWTTSLQRQALMRLLREAAAAADSEGAVSV